MAEVLAKRSLLWPCGGHGFLSLPGKRRSPAFVAFRRRSSPEIGALRSSARNSDFYGRRVVVGGRRGKPLRQYSSSSHVQMSLSVGKSLKWWEKGHQPNMQQIESAQDLVDSLLNSSDKLVIVDFFSPGCGGCRAIHPKICQFYRGANGRLCNFSCTNATIKKFKDALSKNSTDRCSLGPAKGLEEAELLALAANKELSFNYARKPVLVRSLDDVAEKAPTSSIIPVPSTARGMQNSEDKALVASGR